MTFLYGKRVLILQQRRWGQVIGHYLAKRLQTEGCRLGAVTIKSDTHRFVAAQTDVRYEIVVEGDRLKEDPVGFLDGESIGLEEICEALGVNSVWQLVQASRNHVKCYADKYYYGFRQNLSDAEIRAFIKANYKNIRDIFRQFKPDVIITPNFAGLQHIMFNLYASQRSVPMIGTVDSKVTGITRFSLSYLEDKGRFFERLDDLNAGTLSENQDKARLYIEKMRSRLAKPAYSPKSEPADNLSFRRRVAKEFRPYLQIWSYWRSGGGNRLSNLKVSIDDISPRYILRDHYAGMRYQRNADRFPYMSLERVGEYFYLPLQVQPEATLDVHASRFNNQIESIRQVAMSMPGDFSLVVKDHPSMSHRRPPSYLEKISRTPNVCLVDYRESTDVLLRGARMLLSPSSTTLAEAAFLGVPAIQFGDLGTTKALPNVFHHADFSTLGDKIRIVLQTPLKTAGYERALLHFVCAAYDTGFDFDYYNTWRYGDDSNLSSYWDRFREELQYLMDDEMTKPANLTESTSNQYENH